MFQEVRYNMNNELHRNYFKGKKQDFTSEILNVIKIVPVTVTFLRHLRSGDITVQRSKIHGQFRSLKQRPVTSRAVFYRIKLAVARIFTAW